MFHQQGVAVDHYVIHFMFQEALQFLLCTEGGVVPKKWDKSGSRLTIALWFYRIAGAKQEFYSSGPEFQTRNPTT